MTSDQQNVLPDPGKQTKNVIDQEYSVEPKNYATFTRKELTQIQEVLEALSSDRDNLISMTPRFIRSFLFKFQLARLILRVMGESPSFKDLTEALMEEIKSPNTATEPTEQVSPLKTVAQMVA